ncbi:MAG: hypothetical protein WAO00_17710 [Chthoniobacterales bacterium]
MSSLSGGPAEKAGGNYETLWGVRAMLEILQGKAERIRIEEPRVDGAEFWIERDSSREYWQVKRQIISQATWTLSALGTAGVLAFFIEQRRAGHRCAFASITDAPELRTLADRARDAATAAQGGEDGFAEFMAKFLVEKEWREQFTKLRRHWDNATESETFNLLSGIEVRSSDDHTLSQGLSHTLRVMFDAPGRATLDCLRTLYQDNVHQILTAATIRMHLEERGIHPRAFPLGETVLTVLKAITETYISGQRARLIRRQIISRAAARDIIGRIGDARFGQDILITGSAGSGKSGCLLEIVEGLATKDVAVLAFRLDRIQPVQTTPALGAEMGLPESPALVVSRAFPGKKVALVVDQLDCVSTTSGRHPDFFDTFAALIGEVRALRCDAEIHLILACRQFDFEHDARLRALLPKGESPCTLGGLMETEVRGVLAAEGGDVARLTPRQLQLLQLPQNLALFVESGLARADRATFVSQKELFDAYWHTKRGVLAAAWPAEADQWMPIIETLVGDMNEAQELSVPKTRLDAFSPHFLDVMVSEGVLTCDGRRYGFGHESFFDYCFARIFASGRQELSDFLNADAQHLFRRAQTRQVLVYLRDDDRARYIRNVSALLADGKIRAHLKLLILELVAAFPDPSDDEWAILLPRIESELDYLRRNVTNPDKIATRAFEVFRASRNLFPIADRLGYIGRWLHSGESWLENVMVTYLRWQTQDHGDRVTELIEPFVGRGGEWAGRLRYMMEVHDLGRSRRYFELFLRLLDDGTLDEARDRFVSNGTFWSMLYGLSASRPEWCAEVAARWLDRQVARALAARQENQPVTVETDDQAGVHDLFESARKAPRTFLSHVLPAIVRAAEVTLYPQEKDFPRDSIWSVRITGEYISLGAAYLAACEAAFEILGQQNPENMRPFIAQLRSSHTHTANSLLLAAYEEGGEQFAEEAVALLCAEPARLHCGYLDSSHWISRCLIEKLSPYCTAVTFHTLEAVLTDYTTDYERTEDGAESRGRASFTLLSALPTQRCSNPTSERLADLETKFGKPDRAPQGIRSYTVVSPVPEEKAKDLSDDEWLAAIEVYRGVGHHSDWEHPELGGEQEFASMMQNFVKREPERFARLALRFPPDIDSCYWMNVLYGLKEAVIPSMLKIEVARKVFNSDDEACLKAAADLLSRITDEFLPPDAIAFLARLVTEHPDPDRELWRAEKNQTAYYGGDILTCGINTVRGRVAEELRNLLITDRRYLDAFLSTIERLIRDPNISVRACAVSALFGVALHDQELAVSLFHTLSETDDLLLGTHYAEDFIRRGLSAHPAAMRHHIERMLRSEHAKVRQAGGRLATIARLTHAEEDALATTALKSDASTRLGIAEIAEHNFMHPTCREWCEKALGVLFDDADDAVRQQAARCFWHLWQKPDLPLTEYASLIARFLKSAAFASDPSFLLHALEDSRHKLPEVVLDVCEHFVERCSAQARDIRTAHAGDEHTVGPLVFRAYQQLSGEPAQLRALQLIDRMCEEGLHSAAKNLAEFER